MKRGIIAPAAIAMAATGFMRPADALLLPPPPAIAYAIFDVQLDLGSPPTMIPNGPSFDTVELSGGVTEGILFPSTGNGVASAENKESPELASVAVLAQTDGTPVTAQAEATVHYAVIETALTPVTVDTVPIDVSGFISTSASTADPVRVGGVASADIRFDNGIVGSPQEIASSETSCDNLSDPPCTPDIASG